VTRYLGIDYGTRRVGLAISDGLGLTARPLEVVKRSQVAGRVEELVAEYGVDKVVVGMPTGLSGVEGESAVGARELAEELTGISGIEVEFVDERFTSRMAESSLLESGMKRRDRRATVDKVAAAIILQGYLDAQRGSGNQQGR
jgi:putative Holliday junction resolvase